MHVSVWDRVAGSCCSPSVHFAHIVGRDITLSWLLKHAGIPTCFCVHQACADKLKGELEQFGNPPVFPDEIVPQDTAVVSHVLPAPSTISQPSVKPSCRPHWRTIPRRPLHSHLLTLLSVIALAKIQGIATKSYVICVEIRPRLIVVRNVAPTCVVWMK